jgi:hypothetical protein
MSVVYVVLSCIGRGLCDGLITRPEEFYCVSVCVRSRNPEEGGQRSILDYKRLWMWISLPGTRLWHYFAAKGTHWSKLSCFQSFCFQSIIHHSTTTSR